ncbi:MAG TPA: tetratricopeptide repeat protein [Candidatus Krumholzibacteria bacterium]|nr:tetratricopeptide repeat protein [Candidatus Krumholzibacteria bacterium]
MTRVRFILPVGLLALAAFVGCRSAHTTSAILYIDEQNYDKAVQVIHEGFQYSDNEPDAYYYLGEAYSHLGEEAALADKYLEAKKNYELAYEAYMRCLEIDRAGFAEKVETSLRYNYNDLLSKAKRDWDDSYYEQAEGHMRLAYAALPDSTTPIKSIARMKMQMASQDTFANEKDKLLGDALTLLDQVLAQNPGAYDLQLDKASVLASLGRTDEAGALYDQLLAEHGNDQALLLEIANLAIDAKDYARAADFYVKVVDLNEADTDASNDADNGQMLAAAGSWYGSNRVGRYEDAIRVLDRATTYEETPRPQTMLNRVRTYYNYGKKLKDQAETETDAAVKAQDLAKAKELFQRGVEVGVAMTNLYPTNAEGFLYLSMSQVEIGDYTASDTNFKTYQELLGGAGGAQP